MSEEVKSRYEGCIVDEETGEVLSRFEGFEIDEETGEVLVPSAIAGAAVAAVAVAETQSTEEEYIASEDSEELPELHFDFNFGEEEFVNPAENADEDMILQSIDEALAAQMAASLGPAEGEETPKENKKAKKKKSVWKRIPVWCKVTAISLCSVCLVLGLLIGTAPGKKLLISFVTEYLDKNVSRPEDVTPGVTPPPVNQEDPLPTQEPENTENPENPGKVEVPVIEPRHEDYVYNMLLIGVEALPQLGGERSDTMILVSVNSKTKKIYMTSFMRDMYVPMTGYADARLNAAYNRGGAKLLVETIEKNFQVKIDGYVKVGFDSFEWIVDRLGGVEVTLTADEATYLRTHDYISKPQYRNVVAGTQVMNGNQVLGYCRVRKVPTINGTQDDFGRTERQRMVLSKLFNRFKDTNIITLLSIFNDCIPQVLTDVSKEDMQKILEMVVENRILTLESFRIPVAGGFENARVGKADILRVKWDKNITELHNKIFATGE